MTSTANASTLPRSGVTGSTALWLHGKAEAVVGDDRRVPVLIVPEAVREPIVLEQAGHEAQMRLFL